MKFWTMLRGALMALALAGLGGCALFEAKPAAPAATAPVAAPAPAAAAPTEKQIAKAAELKVDPQWVTAAGEIRWPADDGFDGPFKTETLAVGAKIDRYGPPTGKYLSPVGTPFEQRALPGNSKERGYHVYLVAKPVEVDAGKIAPWFGAPGGGTQYRLRGGANVQALLDEGRLIEQAQ